jgi:hypothetical protein
LFAVFGQVYLVERFKGFFGVGLHFVFGVLADVYLVVNLGNGEQLFRQGQTLGMLSSGQFFGIGAFNQFQGFYQQVGFFVGDNITANLFAKFFGVAVHIQNIIL